MPKICGSSIRDREVVETVYQPLYNLDKMGMRVVISEQEDEEEGG